MQKFFTILLIALFAINVSAQDFTVDGINYNMTSANTVGVTSKASKYSGNITIPSTITYYNITYSVTSIGNWTFNDCNSLTSVTIPNSVTSIGDYAFSDCSSLTSIIIPNFVTSIGDYAFSDCSSLTSIIIPNFVTSIGEYTFMNCISFTSVTIGSSVTSIGDYAFVDCSSLISITIPNSVILIGEGAFYGCSGLTSITIPNSVTSIGKGAFGYCIGFTSITIPNSVTLIGDWAFIGCSGLTSINVAIDNLNYAAIDGVLYDKDIKTLIQCPETKTSVIIPNSITSIGNFAFYCCIGLTHIAIPNSVTSIGEGAFVACTSLTSITIPNLVTSIRDYAFSGCIGLTSITCNAIVPPSLGLSVFDNVPKSIALCVPAGSVNAYKAADQWKDFIKMWIVGIESQSSISNSPSSINIYPNPTVSDLHIDVKVGDKSNTNFELINLQGQTISNGNFDGNTTLQTKELEAGVYFIKFINEQQSIDILKFIKQ